MFEQKIDALKILLKKQLSNKDNLHINIGTIVGLVDRIIEDVINPHFDEVNSKPAFWLNDIEIDRAMETLVAIKETILEIATPDEVRDYFHLAIRKIDFTLRNKSKMIEEAQERAREKLKI
jgi:hypothetical protein